MSFKRQYHLKPDEKVRLALRWHPVTLFWNFVLMILALGVPVAGIWLFFGGVPNITNPWAQIGLVLLAGIYALFIWLVFFTQIVNYYIDLSVVTDRRIIDVDQEGLFNRTVSELDLARVQDVTSEIHGIWGTLLNYGRVTVQTAGEQERFILEWVPRPHRVRETILELAHSDREREGKQIISEAIGQER